MAYEYNPDSSRFEIANPHRIENAFLAAAAAICLACALGALLIGRHSLQVSLSAAAAGPILVAAALLGFGILFAVYAMRQLRFFFGRNQPSGLAPELENDAQGSSEPAEALRETLRQNAIKYRIPTGALDNLLYALARDLVFAPPRTQNLAQLEFKSVVGLGFLLLCFAVSMISVQGSVVRSWIAELFFVLTAVLVLKPLRRGRSGGRLSSRFVIALVIAAVIIPVLLPYLVGNTPPPFARYIQLPAVTAVILCCALAVTVLLLLAVLAQQIKPNRIAMAQSLQTVSMNAPPNQIFLEFDREMLRGWTEKIPNRRYLRMLPQLQGNAGAFEGQVIEESQPIPQDIEALTLSRCLNLPAYRWLLLLDVFALVTAATGSGMLLDYAHARTDWGALLMGASLLLIARLAFVGGNRLWRRFEFTSRIYWLECQGNFQRARSSIGALLQDRVKTEKDLVSVEDMTLRLWVAEIDSVSFGPDTPRSLMSIRGLPEEAERLSAHLAGFARQQATIISPQSDVDLQRLSVLNKINPASAASLPSAADALAAGVAGTAAPSAVTSRAFCPQCGNRLDSKAAFCSACGARVGTTPEQG
ncbi:zinc ribbon domain-containing protein [Solimonas terrae]|uniref:Zinc ribbon domain-containing protein n=1 Tax=Solimonas terrae TaxID=1396819 RepID=A0A6M2BVA4_9GAMM|nr:zinc ribbon domain-containing protein [Solimonas terrae]NGY06324.1 zinc ribbon domain-containing protein [Solimonas terrae]